MSDEEADQAFGPAKPNVTFSVTLGWHQGKQVKEIQNNLPFLIFYGLVQANFSVF